MSETVFPFSLLCQPTVSGGIQFALKFFMLEIVVLGIKSESKQPRLNVFHNAVENYRELNCEPQKLKFTSNPKLIHNKVTRLCFLYESVLKMSHVRPNDLQRA